MFFLRAPKRIFKCTALLVSVRLRVQPDAVKHANSFRIHFRTLITFTIVLLVKPCSDSGRNQALQHWLVLLPLWVSKSSVEKAARCCTIMQSAACEEQPSGRAADCTRGGAGASLRKKRGPSTSEHDSAGISVVQDSFGVRG